MTRPQMTVVRTIMLVLTLLNDLLIFYGKSPINIDESTVYQIVTVLFQFIRILFFSLNHFKLTSI